MAKADAGPLDDYAWFAKNSALPGFAAGTYHAIGTKKPSPPCTWNQSAATMPRLSVAWIRLQRVPPDIRIFLPTLLAWSITCTTRPRWPMPSSMPRGCGLISRVSGGVSLRPGPRWQLALEPNYVHFGETMGDIRTLARPFEIFVSVRTRLPVWSAALMLEHLGESEAAARVLAALERVCREGPRTRDPVEREDRVPDVLDRGIELVDRRVELEPHARVAHRCGRLQGHSRGEEPLDDVVVHVPSNPLPILVELRTGSLRSGAGGPQRDSEAPSEVREVREVLASGPAALSNGDLLSDQAHDAAVHAHASLRHQPLALRARAEPQLRQRARLAQELADGRLAGTAVRQGDRLRAPLAQLHPQSLGLRGH